MIEEQITRSLKAFVFTVIVACGGSWWIVHSEGMAYAIRRNIFGIVMIIMTLCLIYAVWPLITAIVNSCPAEQ